VANILQAMGMFMLSPTVISLPFKLLLFVLVNGWELIIKNLVLQFT
jgi:flagellar biosynthesis protein FliP